MFRAAAVGKRVAANNWFAMAGNVQIKCDVLPRLEWRQRLAVVRRQIKRTDVVALGDFFRDLEFAVAVPDEFELFDFLDLHPRGLDLQPQTLAGKRALLALKINPAESSETNRGDLQHQKSQQNQSDRQTDAASGRGAKVFD